MTTLLIILLALPGVIGLYYLFEFLEWLLDDDDLQ